MSVDPRRSTLFGSPEAGSSPRRVSILPANMETAAVPRTRTRRNSVAMGRDSEVALRIAQEDQKEAAAEKKRKTFDLAGGETKVSMQKEKIARVEPTTVEPVQQQPTPMVVSSSSSAAAASTTVASSATASVATNPAMAAAAEVPNVDRTLHERIPSDVRGADERFYKLASMAMDKELTKIETTCRPEEQTLVVGLRRIAMDFLFALEKKTIEKRNKAPQGNLLKNPRNIEISKALEENMAIEAGLAAELRDWNKVTEHVAEITRAGEEIARAPDALFLDDEQKRILEELDPQSAAKYAVLDNLPTVARNVVSQAETVYAAVAKLKQVQDDSENFYKNVQEDFFRRSWKGYGNIKDSKAIIEALTL